MCNFFEKSNHLDAFNNMPFCVNLKLKIILDNVLIKQDNTLITTQHNNRQTTSNMTLGNFLGLTGAAESRDYA